MIAKANTFSRTVDLIGSAICAGIFEEGRVFTVQQMVDLTGASRSIVREATQVLAATDPPLSRASLHSPAPSSAHPETRPSAISPRSSRPPSGIESGGSRGADSYDRVAVDLHVDLAQHIVRRHPDRAEQAMLEVVNRTTQSP